MNDEKLVWKCMDSTELLHTKILTVNELTSVSPEGDDAKFIVMDANDWVVVIPEIDDDFLMVKQWRHGENRLSIEFPGGVIEKDELPEVAARRELFEETGYEAGELKYLGKANPNPAIMSNHVHFFSAANLKAAGDQKLDEEEFVEYLRISKKEVIRNFGSELYSHSLMMSALLRYIVNNNGADLK